MAAYITIAVGADIEQAQPVFVSDDPSVIGATLEAVLERITDNGAACGECER